MNSRSNRLQPIDWLVVLLAGSAGLIHLTIGISQLGSDDSFLPVAFILNGLAYLVLILAAYFLAAFRHYRELLEWALIALAALTIILYFVFNGVAGLTNPLGMLTKGIELVLIIVLVYDLGH